MTAAMRAACEAGYVSTADYVKEKRMSELFPIMLLKDYGNSERSESVRAARASGDFFVVVGVPWAMLAPHEAQAQHNHGQTLQRLADRGGLSASEALDILDGRRWAACPLTHIESNRELAKRVAIWLSSKGTPTP